MTKFRALLEYIEDIEKEALNEAILEYFNKEDENEFIIDGCTYYVYDYDEVKEMLRDQYKDEVKEFERSLRGSDYPHLAELIDYETIVHDLVYNFDYEKLEFLAFLDQVYDYYIYQDE